ncbi:DUF397 domain-containing protein [Streptomyces fungicidicus]|uniref:DUF397 domain-containing protein n=1 Tax=Streptomyces fungicidicus TaxID=68203 RepID=UPI00363E8196
MRHPPLPPSLVSPPAPRTGTSTHEAAAGCLIPARIPLSPAAMPERPSRSYRAALFLVLYTPGMPEPRGECVEVAPDAVSIPVRDSKGRGGPRLTFPPERVVRFRRGSGTGPGGSGLTRPPARLTGRPDPQAPVPPPATGGDVFRLLKGGTGGPAGPALGLRCMSGEGRSGERAAGERMRTVHERGARTDRPVCGRAGAGLGGNG